MGEVVRQITSVLVIASLTVSCTGFSGGASDQLAESGHESAVSVHHLPIRLDLPSLTPTQLQALDDADVPRDTVIHVPTTTLDGTKLLGARIMIIDVADRATGPRQEISVVTDGRSDAAMTAAAEPKVTETVERRCEGPDAKRITVRGHEAACTDSSAAWIRWSEHGQWFEATLAGRTQLRRQFRRWVEDLRLVELGASGPPYRKPYCATELARCA